MGVASVVGGVVQGLQLLKINCLCGAADVSGRGQAAAFGIVYNFEN